MTSLVQKLFLPASEPDATPGNHYCLGPNCPRCKRGRNVGRSHGDHPRTPNHYCLGPGCPKCNTTPNTTLRAMAMSLPSIAFHSVTTSDDAEFPRFFGRGNFSDSEVSVRSSTLRSTSEPEPPHYCSVIPCKVCGRRWY